ncbi:MAG: metallophosphoesterase family protein [Chloroflexota bacterium]
MKLLILSDTVVEAVYSTQLLALCRDVNLVLCCGDLPYSYIEYVVSVLNVPVYHVRGNHSNAEDDPALGRWLEPAGAIDLHGRVVNAGGLLLAGVEGSHRYRPGAFQYSQAHMWLHVGRLLPSLLWNRLRYGRFLDVFVTHAPPAGIHDDDDIPHHGIRAFRWLIDIFQPRYHFHGHVHIYRRDAQTITPRGKTQVINTYGYRLLEVEGIGFSGTVPPADWPRAKPDRPHRPQTP